MNDEYNAFARPWFFSANGIINWEGRKVCDYPHEDHAAAHLIRSAPDLLRELKRIVNDIAQVYEMAGDDASHLNGAFEIIRRAELGMEQKGKPE